jgi:hypothetical protein
MLLGGMLLGGCYTREPLATPVPAPAVRIVATVTDTGAVVMGNTIGTGASEVEGVVAEATDTGWTLHMVRVEHRDGRSVPWNREVVSFPINALDNPSVVVLNKQRSWAFAGGVVVGALLLGRMFNVFGSTEDDRTRPEEPQHILVPVGRP